MARSRIAFHPDAVAEARAARLWYQERSRQAAEGFLAELSRALEFITRHPTGTQESGRGDRRFVLRTYPFLIACRVQGDQIQIIAAAHSHRRPDYWKER